MNKIDLKTIDITKATDEDKLPMELLYLADESEEAISDYTKRGECYIALFENKEIGVFVLLPTRPFTIELVNLAVAEDYQNKGIGKYLVNYAIEIAKENKYKTIEVGTGNAGIRQLALYQKCGFQMTWIDYDFFRRHYSKPIFENGLECRHMVRLSLDL